MLWIVTLAAVFFWVVVVAGLGIAFAIFAHYQGWLLYHRWNHLLTILRYVVSVALVWLCDRWEAPYRGKPAAFPHGYRRNRWAAHHLSLEESAKVIRKTYNIKVNVHPAAKSGKVAPSKEKVSYKAIFQGKYSARTLLASIITFTQSMEYFAVGFYIPTISTILFGKGVIYAITGTIIFNLFGAHGGFLGSSLNTRLGVRKLSLIGYVVATLGLVCMGTAGNAYVGISAVLLAAFIFGHVFGPGSQGMTMATLSYPTELRGLGTGFGQGITRVGSVLGFFLFPVVLAAAGLYNTILLLAIVPFLGLIATLLIKWEPIGKDIENEEHSLAS